MNDRLWKAVSAAALLILSSCGFGPDDVVAEATVTSTELKNPENPDKFNYQFANNSTRSVHVVTEEGDLSQYFTLSPSDSLELDAPSPLKFEYNLANRVDCTVSDGLVVFTKK